MILPTTSGPTVSSGLSIGVIAPPVRGMRYRMPALLSSM